MRKDLVVLITELTFREELSVADESIKKTNKKIRIIFKKTKKISNQFEERFEERFEENWPEVNEFDMLEEKLLEEKLASSQARESVI